MLTSSSCIIHFRDLLLCKRAHTISLYMLNGKSFAPRWEGKAEGVRAIWQCDKQAFCHGQAQLTQHEISSEMTQITRNSIADWTRSFEIKGSRQRQMRWKMYLVNRLMSMFELSLFCSLDNLKSLPLSLSLSLESNWYQLQFISAFLLLIRDKHALAYESESSASNLISTTSSLSTIT